MSGFAASPGKEELRDKLAADVVSRIRGQAAGASPEVKAVLEEIAGRLFDEDLMDDLTEWLPAARREIRRELREATGASGRALVVEARLEVASRLLREPGARVTVAEAGRLVGYSAAPNFHHAFKNRFEISPGAWRGLSAPKAEVEAVPGPETCRRILAGPWPKDDGPILYELGLDFLGHLAEGYPAIGEKCCLLFGSAAGPFRADDFAYETFKAVSVFEAVREEPLPLGLVGVRYPVPMGSLLLFELLHRGGPNRAGKARDARLALASLDACTERLASLIPEYQALATLSLARAALRRGEIGAAQSTLAFAAAYRSQARPFSDPAVEAAFLETKAELRLLGGAVTEAFELASRAAGLYRRQGRRREAARCLLLRERARRGTVTPAEVAELEEALAAEPRGTGPLVLRLGGELAAAYTCQGRLEAATSMLNRLRDLVNQ